MSHAATLTYIPKHIAIDILEYHDRFKRFHATEAYNIIWGILVDQDDYFEYNQFMMKVRDAFVYDLRWKSTYARYFYKGFRNRVYAYKKGRSYITQK